MMATKKRTGKKPVSRVAASRVQPNGQHGNGRDVPRGEHDGGTFWALRLYVAGQTPKSITAFANLKRLCEQNLPGRYKIEVIDLLENPQLAANDQIVAVPTLVRKLPAPLKKVIGDLSNTEKALVGLDLRPIG